MTGRLSMRRSGLNDAALDDGQLFVRDFDAQIAARHHDAPIGFLNDGIQILDRLLVFNLGDDGLSGWLYLPQTFPVVAARSRASRTNESAMKSTPSSRAELRIRPVSLAVRDAEQS